MDNTRLILPTVGTDHRYGKNMLMYAPPTPAHIKHIGMGLNASAYKFWDGIREANGVPKSFKDIPTGHLLQKFEDKHGLIKKAAKNVKVTPTKIDRANYVMVTGFAVTPIVQARSTQQHRRGHTIGKFGVMNMLRVPVDGR